MAKHYGYLRHTDGITFDRARLLHDAKQRALGLSRAGYHHPAPRSYKLPGESGIATIKMLVGSMMAAGETATIGMKPMAKTVLRTGPKRGDLMMMLWKKEQ
jgi:hypothetical protein